MSPEEFRNIAQGVQAILICFAAVFGGIWAILRFGITKELQKAKLEVENLQAEAYKLGGVTCEIEITHKEYDGKYYAYADFTLINMASRSATYRCDNFPFHVKKVSEVKGGFDFKEISRQQISDPASDDKAAWRFATSITFLPNTPVRLSFFCELSKPGNYQFCLLLEGTKPEPKLNSDKIEFDKVDQYYQEHKNHPLHLGPLTWEKKCSTFYLIT